MRRGYPYIRFSSPGQQEGDSLRRQLRECRQWCERNDVVFDDSLDYLKELGKTAFTGSNLEEGGGLGLFLAAVKAGHIQPGSVLLVEKLDRFSRTDIDIAVSFFGKVLRAGVSIVSIRSGQEYTLEMLRRQPTAILPAVIEFILANEESVKKSDRLASAWAHKREEARADNTPMTAQCPLWLKLSEDRRSWEVIEEKVKVVQRIFEETANGMGGYRLAALLNREKVQPMGRTKVWSQMGVYKVLINRAVLGEFQPQRKVDGNLVNDGDSIQGYFPSVVDDGLFYRAQQQTRTNTSGGRKAGGRTGHCFLFQKLVFDAVGGSSLMVKPQAVTAAPPHRYVRYLMPYDSMRGGPHVTIRADDFEEVMLKGLSEIRPEEILASNTDDEVQQRMDDVKGRLAELSSRIHGATQAMANQPANLMGVVVSQIATWEKEKVGLAVELDTLRTKSAVTGETVVSEFHSVVSLIRSCSPEESTNLRRKLRAVIRSLLKKVTVLIRPGKNRLEKRIAALVEFNHSQETRVFFFKQPFETLLVLKGYTADDLECLLS